MQNKVLLNTEHKTIYYEVTKDLINFILQNNLTIALVNNRINPKTYKPTRQEIELGKKALMQEAYRLVADPLFFNMIKGKETKENYLASINAVRRQFRKPLIRANQLVGMGGIDIISGITYEVGANKQFRTLAEALRKCETIKTANASEVRLLIAEGTDIGGSYNLKNVCIPIRITSANKWVKVTEASKGNIIIANATFPVWFWDIKINNEMQYREIQGRRHNYHKNDIAQAQNRTGFYFKNCLEGVLSNTEFKYMEVNYISSRGFLYSNFINTYSPYCALNIREHSFVISENCRIRLEKCKHFFMEIWNHSSFLFNKNTISCDKSNFVNETTYGGRNRPTANNWDGGGIYLFNNSHMSVWDNARLTISNTGHNGICCVHNSSMVIHGQGATISNTGHNGIYCAHNSSMDIHGQGATISNTGHNGIYCVNNSSMGIHGQGATISNTGHNGICCVNNSSMGIHGQGATISNTGHNGICCVNNSSMDIHGQGATISNTGHNGICCGYLSKMSVTTLRITENHAVRGEAFINVREHSEYQQCWNCQHTLIGRGKTYQLVVIQHSRFSYWGNKWSNQTGKGNLHHAHNSWLVAK